MKDEGPENCANAIPRRKTLARLVAAILAVHAGLMAWVAARHSPTIHEMGHLPAGICHWQFGMFELYRVNPPLPRMVAALPVLLCDPKTDWGNYQLDPLSRETIPMGIRFAKANGARTIFLFMMARWACIPFSLLGGWVCYRWGTDLWGDRSGLMSLCLWCFNPMILGHGAVVMPDVPGAAMGVFAAWRFWKWLREPVWSTALLAGLALGLAELCKTTLLIFFLLWPAAWLVYRRHYTPRDGTAAGHPLHQKGPVTRSGTHRRTVVCRDRLREAFQLLAIFSLAVYLINFGYAFKDSCRPLGEYRFESRLLSGQPRPDPPKIGNRFAGTWLGPLPIPLPHEYVQGVDCQRNDFEVGGRSYLHSRWEPHGWWYFYFAGFGIKTPLGTLAALVMVVAITVAEFVRIWARRADGDLLPLPLAEGGGEDGTCPLPFREGWGRWGEGGMHKERATATERACPTGRGSNSLASGCTWCDELLLLTPAIAIFTLVGSQTGFSAHVRYAIPALPYFFIWCAKLAEARRELYTNPKHARGPLVSLRRLRFGLVSLCVVATAIESLSVYPHSLSFFNLLVGGPAHGHEWLLDSNGPWGQDLVLLTEWVERHPAARPLRLASVGWLDPQALGIDYTLPPVGPSRPVSHPLPPREGRGEGGWRGHVASRRGDSAIAAHRAERDGYCIPQTWEDVRLLDDLGPKPGWYAIDVNLLHGTYWPANWPGWLFQKIAEDALNYEYFRLFEPSDKIGYSYLLYHIAPEEANRVRRELGLPVLPTMERSNDE